MTPYEAIRTVLRSHPQIAATVGDRIRPDRLQAEDDLPAIVVGVRWGSPSEQLHGDCDGRFTASVECRAESRLAADELADAVRELDGAEVADGLDTWHLFAGSEDHGAVLAERESDDADYVARVDLDVWRIRC